MTPRSTPRAPVRTTQEEPGKHLVPVPVAARSDADTRNGITNRTMNATASRMNHVGGLICADYPASLVLMSDSRAAHGTAGGPACTSR
jgi:hypothetical protein